MRVVSDWRGALRTVDSAELNSDATPPADRVALALVSGQTLGDNVECSPVAPRLEGRPMAERTKTTTWARRNMFQHAKSSTSGAARPTDADRGLQGHAAQRQIRGPRMAAPFRPE